MVPSGVGGYESGTHELAGVVVHSEQEGLLVLSGPPLMDGGIVLPEFAQAGAFPATARLRLALGQGDQRREVGAGIGGNGSAVAERRNERPVHPPQVGSWEAVVAAGSFPETDPDRKSVVEGKSVDPGGRRIIKNK